jgi:1-acyl-sn-glycerol-3-phosphate acyltransferase
MQRTHEATGDGLIGFGVVLLRKLDFAWRLIGTGLGFVVFLGGGALLAVIAFPSIDLLTPGASRRRERYHALLRWAFRAFVDMLAGLRVIEVEIDDPVALRDSKGVIVVANHPTLIDIVLLSAFIPRAQCIVKRELWDSPFLGRLMRGSGYIPNDLEPEALVDACRAALADGRSLIIFPEGTRSRPGMPLRFQRGFAHLATLLEADLQLALISCAPPTLAKGEKWWAIPTRRPHFRVSAVGWIRAASWQSDSYRSLAARDITRRVERFYNEQLSTG